MPCKCTEAGNCETLGGVKMTQHRLELCRRSEGYRRLFWKRFKGEIEPCPLSYALPYSLPVIPSPPLIDCVSLGDVAGFRWGTVGPAGAVHICRHARHGETLLESCKSCPDRVARPVGDPMGISADPSAEVQKMAYWLPPYAQGPPVRRWAIGITTAPRDQSTIAESLASMRAAGFPDPTIFAEPGSPIPAEHSGPVVVRSERAGAWGNFHLACVELLQRNRDADAFLLCQDDIVWTAGDRFETMFSFLSRALWPHIDASVVSLYCALPYAQNKPGWYKFERRWVWGACCFVFRREALQDFLATKAASWATSGYGHELGVNQKYIDMAIGRWSLERKRPIWYPSPSIVQHIGYSTIGMGPPTGDRKARDVLGNLIA